MFEIEAIYSFDIPYFLFKNFRLIPRDRDMIITNWNVPTMVIYYYSFLLHSEIQ